MNSAFSTELGVQNVAKRLLAASDAIHVALRKCSDQIIGDGTFSSYAILTEEYALRARINILLNEAKHFVLNDTDLESMKITDLFELILSRLRKTKDAYEIYELTVALSLFATSIASRRPHSIRFQVNELTQIASCYDAG